MHGPDRNNATRISTIQRLPSRSVRDLYLATYDAFAPICRAADHAGLAIIAIDETTAKLADLLVVPARIAQPTVAIVGRHDRSDLFLPARDELALRHLAILADPITSYERGATCTYRVLDLRTGTGLLDEHGRRLGGIHCDGPSVVRCAGYTIFVLALGDPTDWPASSADAWSYIPERVYLTELPPFARGSKVSMLPERRSQITQVNPPRDATNILVNGDLVGTLELRGPTRRTELRVGAAALRDGILLGRYERCDAGGVDDETLSRVHGLVISLGDRVHLFDTASTYGTSLGDAGAGRVFALTDATRLTLAEATELTWRVRSSPASRSLA